MKIVLIVLGIAVMVALLVSVYNIWNNHYVYSQFKTFNDNIADWSRELDNNTRDAINRQAILIIQEMDERIEHSKNDNVQEEDENNNDNNLNENDKD